MIKVYDFLGRPHVLPFHVPLKIGVANLLWQIETIVERNILGKCKGAFFPIVTMVHDFVFFKKGWRHLSLFLDRYHMDQSHARYIDLEGFYDLLRERTKAKSLIQTMYFLEDFIRNVFSLQEQEVRKEKWVVFSKVLEFINSFKPNYNPLVDKKY